jgi:hypothetical protein
VIGRSADVDQATRLSIYGDGYFLRIVDVMAANYEVLCAVAGEHEFRHHLARAYLVKHPSTYKCIDNVGNRMADFLKRYPLTRQLPFLPDLARVEWAFHESFYADEWPLFDPAKFAGVPVERWAGARITLDPSVRLLSLAFPVVPLWRDNGRWARRRLSSIRREPSFVLVYRRPDGQVRVAEETPGAFALLEAFAAGRPLGQALKKAGRKGLAEARALPLFREWTELGIIRRVAFS